MDKEKNIKMKKRFLMILLLFLILLLWFVFVPMNSMGISRRQLWTYKVKDDNTSSSTNWLEDELNGNVNKTEYAQKLFVAITDFDGTTVSTEIINGDINDRYKIEQFAKNLAKNPGYSYIGGSWNEINQFLGVINTPAGKMLIGIRAAD